MKSRSILILSLLLSTILGGCGGKSTSPESKKATVTITASRQDQPVDSALVTVFSSSGTGGLVAVGTTNEDGKCSLSGIGSGNYVISVSKSIQGQLIYGTKSNVQISAGANVSQSVEVDQQVDDLFPLALGNTWTFSDGADSTRSLQVFSTKIINGTITYAMGPEGMHPGYYTRGVTALYQHGFENTLGQDYFFDRPTVFLHFGASPGDMWKVEDWGRVELMNTASQVTAPAGTFENCL